ncbi:hypothetical protein AAVH_08169 [Aphelenchoides avenae]|nr:hypothetical protein AAVH_08169 [Aphelenchus avenae]
MDDRVQGVGRLVVRVKICVDHFVFESLADEHEDSSASCLASDCSTRVSVFANRVEAWETHCFHRLHVRFLEQGDVDSVVYQVLQQLR